MSYMEDLLESARARVDELQALVTPEALEQRLAAIDAPRGFRAALAGPDTAIIAEIKRASPAAGPLNLDLNAGETACRYADGGAAAVSVLTETKHFRGTMDDLVQARGAGLPVLRKDFILDDLQVLESRAAGADAVLLIVRAVGGELRTLMRACEVLGMDALVEVHDEDELDRALECGATMIGVNHRDLETFEVDPDRTAKLAPLVPQEVTLIGLSGVSSRAEVEALSAAGAAAVLVGESLVTARDPAAVLRELRGVS
nr:indole-3-glycerol phosphate synthase TrpC [Actinomycetota bacterium]